MTDLYARIQRLDAQVRYMREEIEAALNSQESPSQVYISSSSHHCYMRGWRDCIEHMRRQLGPILRLNTEDT